MYWYVLVCTSLSMYWYVQVWNMASCQEGRQYYTQGCGAILSSPRGMLNYVLVHWYILFCTSMYQYVLVHTSTYLSTYLYVLVKTAS